MADFKKEQLAGWFREYGFPASSFSYWDNAFSRVRKGEIDTWDYQWIYANWKHGGLSIIPCTNLVANIGFGEESTHTTSAESPFANMDTGNIGLITFRPDLVPDREADLYTFDKWFRKRSLTERTLDRFKKMIR